MSNLIDIHCHILPSVDDGPDSSETAATLVQELYNLGFREFFPTPHQKSESWAPTEEEREHASQSLKEKLEELNLPVVIHPSAGENMWDDLFFQRQNGGYPTYPGGASFLVEFNLETPPPQVLEHLFQFRISGKLPVIAHVERYPYLLRNETLLEKLGQTAALLINLSSLGGMGGWMNRRMVRKLVEKRLIHAAATDSHNSVDVTFAKKGLNWLQKVLGENVVDILLHQNPKRIVSGELPEW